MRVAAVESAGGGSAGSATTDANGNYVIDINPSFDIAPFNVGASLFDGCKPSGQNQLTAGVSLQPDGAVQNFTLDAFTFCGAFKPFNAADPTGNDTSSRLDEVPDSGQEHGGRKTRSLSDAFLSLFFHKHAPHCYRTINLQ